MCLSKRCFCFDKLDFGCLLIGISSLMTSFAIWVSCIVMLGAEESKNWVIMHAATEHFLSTMHLDVNQKSKDLVLSLVILITTLNMVASAALIFGVRKRRAGFILPFFAFGVFATSFLMTGALLLLLKNCWWFSLVLLGASLLNIHFLIVVHTFYDQLVSGKTIGDQLHLPEFEYDTDLLIIESNS